MCSEAALSAITEVQRTSNYFLTAHKNCGAEAVKAGKSFVFTLIRRFRMLHAKGEAFASQQPLDI